MSAKCLLLLAFSVAYTCSFGQQGGVISCGQQTYNDRLFNTDPALRAVQSDMEKKLLTRKRSIKVSNNPARPLGIASAPVVLPVVVHIIHNNGPENISDLQVMTAIQHLNEAFANTGYYDPSDGVNTNIQFCLAGRDPDNNPTNGITRDVSPYTVMNSPVDPLNFIANDQHVKNIRRWNPFCYINIWIVQEIATQINGYAVYPSAHGNDLDGIVVRAANFGSSYASDVVITHEMGHYLGLYHTFNGGCANTDCSIDGDQVCDTPPDQSTAPVACGHTMNSCSTDALSGFSTDQNDLVKDYMDYGNIACMTVFTQGQSDRMNGFIQTARSSLLACKSCMMPCPSPVKLSFVLPSPVPDAGMSCVFSNTSSGASSYEWYVNGVLVSNAYNLDYTFPAVGSYTIRLVGKTGDVLCVEDEKTAFLYIACPQGGCVTVPPWVTDTCRVNTFQKQVGGAAFYQGENVQTDVAGNYLITGTTLNNISGPGNGSAMKFDPGGNFLWGKVFAKPSFGNIYGATILPSGSLLAEYGSGVYRLDDQGNVLWSRRYTIPSTSVQHYGCIATQDGNFLLLSFAGTLATNLPAILTKIDGSGNILWTKEYYTNNTTFPVRVLEDGNQFIVAAKINSIDILVFAADKVTGAFNWGKKYSFPFSTNSNVYQLLSLGDRLLLAFSYTKAEAGGLSSNHQGIFYLDKQGMPQGAFAIDGLPGAIGGRTVATVMSDGTLCFSYGPLALTDAPDVRVARVNPDGTLVSAKRYVTGQRQSLYSLQGTVDGGVVALGNTTIPGQPGKMYVLKTDKHLMLADPTRETAGCSVVDENPLISQPAVMATDLPTTAIDAAVIARVNDAVPTDLSPMITDYCSNAALCQTLKISGSDSVCVSASDTLVFKSGKEADCALPVQWRVDPAAVKIVATTDSSVRLVFKKAGVTMLYASLAINCKILYDSLVIHAFQSPSGIDLGGDLALCRQSTVQLHAGSGFSTYQWQDGFVDSVYTAWLPGEYFVNAQDYCGHSYGDTVRITVAPDIPFDLGPDTTVCRNDTLVLTAPDGFLQYTWSPDYGISAVTGQSVSLYPARDTMYSCTAVKGRGCTLTDSIRVNVRELPEGFLRSGEAVCIGIRTIRLRPSGDWAVYTWFDNSTGPTVIVRSPGEYWLEVTDTNKCVGRDSIRVLPGVCNPGVYFPNAFTPDHNGNNDIFRPVVTVPLDGYYMAVYNRWGERIFETRDFREGWDGRYKGKALAPDAFVWYAVYHIQGSQEKEKTVKGTVLLIH